MTKKLPIELKQTRKPIQTACGFCHEKHLQCDVGRPCQNCSKRNRGYLCRDKVRKQRKRSSSVIEIANQSEMTNYEDEPIERSERIQSGEILETSGTTSHNSMNVSTINDEKAVTSQDTNQVPMEALSRIQSLSNILNNPSNSFLNDPFISNMVNENADFKNQLERYLKKKQPTSDNSPMNQQFHFDSMWAGNEYMKLNDIAGIGPTDVNGEEGSHIDGNQDQKHFNGNDSINRSSSSQLFQYLNTGPSIYRTDSRPYISLDLAKSNSISQTDSSSGRNAVNKSDSNGPSPQQSRELELTPYKLRQLIKTPKDLFEKQHMIKPHNYRAASIALLQCLHRMFLGSYVHPDSDTMLSFDDHEDQNQKRSLRRNQLKQIARSIANRYAPIFVTLTSNMIEDDLLLQEIILQRTLLELENMARLVNCTPICIWRRSGEICFVSNEFLSLTGFSKKEILDERRFIIEFLDHQSVVNYYELFHEYLAFGSKEGGRYTTSDGQTVFGECNLLLHSGSFLKCACCWTVKRDNFNISLLVMGQFLPIFDVE